MTHGLRSSDTLAKLRTLLPLLYDPRVGLIQSITEHERDSGSPEFFRFIATAADTGAFCAQQNFSIGGGAATSRDVALAKAIGEAVERYAAAIYDRHELPFGARRKLAFECVPPQDFALFSRAQYQDEEFVFEPFHDDSEVRWAAVRSLTTRREVHVPACFVYVPYIFYRSEEEWPLAQSISTGLSCHGSFEQAAIGGICEVIERDAFTLTWQARLSHPRIRLASLSRANRDLVCRFERAGYELGLVDITLDTGVPTILAVVRNRTPGGVPLAVAAATELDAETAVRKSLEELAHTERYMCQVKREVPRLIPTADHSNVTSQVSHVNFWCSPEHAEQAAFLTQSSAHKDFAEIQSVTASDDRRALTQLIERVAATGHDVLIKEISTPDVSELGLCVVRAIIPGFHPLFMGYQGRALGGRRLWELPQRLGFAGIDPQAGDNPFPHPFP
jgi:ribosomal protein S12 methylthiotransferase accessory factor